MNCELSGWAGGFEVRSEDSGILGWNSAIAVARGRDSLRTSVTPARSPTRRSMLSSLVDDGSARANDAELLTFALTAAPVSGSLRKKARAELTPFMRQWTAAKRQNPDALLFFRMGDFYELFYDDAAVASRELQLTLTARDKERNVPMCGVPYHAVEQYLSRLLRKGYRIALCDQMEDPKLTKKIVRREVTRVLSPGTALDAGLGQEQNNFLAALYEERGARAGPRARLRAGAARRVDGRVSHAGVSRRKCAGAGDG